MNDETKDLLLGVFEESLEAQLRAVRRLRRGPPGGDRPRPGKGLSQVDMAFDILKKARAPLHISALLDRIQAHFGVTIDRESLVSSLTKKVARGDRFLRPEKNTFALRPQTR
jgi:hypothetical protein